MSLSIRQFSNWLHGRGRCAVSCSSRNRAEAQIFVRARDLRTASQQMRLAAGRWRLPYCICSFTNVCADPSPIAASIINRMPSIDPTAAWRPPTIAPMQQYRKSSICLLPVDAVPSTVGVVLSNNLQARISMIWQPRHHDAASCTSAFRKSRSASTLKVRQFKFLAAKAPHLSTVARRGLLARLHSARASLAQRACRPADRARPSLRKRSVTNSCGLCEARRERPINEFSHMSDDELVALIWEGVAELDGVYWDLPGNAKGYPRY
jgi:hypothetical protein